MFVFWLQWRHWLQLLLLLPCALFRQKVSVVILAGTIRGYKCNKKAVLSQRWPRDARYISRSYEPLRRYGLSKLSKMAAAAILDLFEPKIAPLDMPSPKPHDITKHKVDRTTGCGNMATWNFFQDVGGRHLGFVRTVNSSVRSAVPENPTL